MANLFAVLNDNYKVVNIVVGNDFNLTTEAEMSSFMSININKIKKYSNDGSYLNRGTPSVGDFYLENEDYFKPYQVFPSWTYNETKRKWEAPVISPEEYKNTYNYWWDENNLRWLGYVRDANPRVDFIWNSVTKSWENL